MQKVINLGNWLATHNAYKEFEIAIKKANRRKRVLEVLEECPNEVLNQILWSSNQYSHIVWATLHWQWGDFVASRPRDTKYVLRPPVLLGKVK